VIVTGTSGRNNIHVRAGTCIGDSVKWYWQNTWRVTNSLW